MKIWQRAHDLIRFLVRFFPSFVSFTPFFYHPVRFISLKYRFDTFSIPRRIIAKETSRDRYHRWDSFLCLPLPSIPTCVWENKELCWIIHESIWINTHIYHTSSGRRNAQVKRALKVTLFFSFIWKLWQKKFYHFVRFSNEINRHLNVWEIDFFSRSKTRFSTSRVLRRLYRRNRGNFAWSIWQFAECRVSSIM